MDSNSLESVLQCAYNKCAANPDKNIKKHLIKSIRGYEIDGGLHIPITYDMWEEVVIMNRFRKGELHFDHLSSNS